MSRLFVAVASAMTAFFCLAPSAGAAIHCGTEPAGGGEPVQGTLLLKTEPSTTSLNFEGSSTPKNLEFAFEIGGGCELPSAEQVTATVHASEGSEAFGTPEIEVADSELTVQLPVDPEKFDAGKHTAAVTVNGPAIVGAVTKVSFQRSETWLLPTLLTVAFGLIGVGAAIFAKHRVVGDKNVKVKPRRLVLALGAAVIPVAAVWLSAYGEVEIWQPSAVSIVTLFLATVAAASGPAGAALLGESTEPKQN
jgi:hypothetical protein